MTMKQPANLDRRNLSASPAQEEGFLASTTGATPNARPPLACGFAVPSAIAASLLLLLGTGAILADPPPTSGPTTSTYTNKNAGFSVGYPTNWQEKPSKDDVLMIVPGGAKDNDPRNLTIDEPSLPPHFSWMISMKKVEKGYLDDLKKQHKDLQIQDDCDKDLPECKGRFVRTTWADGSTHMVEATVLTIHDNHVYLFTVDTDADRYDACRAVFDQVVGSLQWVKK